MVQYLPTLSQKSVVDNDKRKFVECELSRSLKLCLLYTETTSWLLFLELRRQRDNELSDNG